MNKINSDYGKIIHFGHPLLPILQNEALQRDITDLQSEFEFDRIDYLDTIRKLESQQELGQALIDRIHPCLRRDCNYSNLDR